MNKITVYYSQEEIEKMRAMYKEGKTYNEIAKFYGRSHSYIRNLISGGHQKMVNATKQIVRETLEAIKMREKGMTLDEIADRQNITTSAVRNRIQRFKERSGIYKTLYLLKE